MVTKIEKLRRDINALRIEAMAEAMKERAESESDQGVLEVRRMLEPLAAELQSFALLPANSNDSEPDCT